MPPQITVQLFSLREELARDFEGTLRAVAEIGFPCVEPLRYCDRSPGEFKKQLTVLGLTSPTALGKLPLGDDKNEVIETALEMGHQYLFTGRPPGWGSDLSSADEIKAIAARYAEAASNAAEHGLMVGYHNHDWDLITVEGRPAYQIMLENTPETVLWEADLFWIARAGFDPVEFIKEIGPRGRALHFKDGLLNDRESETPFLPAGEGEVKLVEAAAAAKHAEYIAVELDAYRGDMLEAIRKSYAYLTNNGIARGKR